MSDQFQADIILNGVNNASEAFDEVQSSGGKLKDFLGGLGSGAMAELKEQAGSLASEGFGKLKDGIGNLVSGAITGLPGLLKESIDKTAAWAERLDGLGDVLGTTGEESAGLIVAIQGVGGNAEAMSGQMVKLVKGLTNAKGELGPTGKILDEMGVSFKDANGNMLSSAQILQNVANVVGTMPDGLEKTTLMTQLFGKSGKDLSDVMGALANDGLTKAQEKAKGMGLALSDDVINSSIQSGRAMNQLQLSLQGVVTSIGGALVPALAPLLTALAGLTGQIIGALMPAVQPLVALLGQLITAILPYVQQGIALIVGVVSQAAQAFAQLVTGADIGGWFTNLQTNASNLLTLFQGKSFAELLGLDPETAELIKGIFAEISKPFVEFGTWMAANWPQIETTFKTVLQSLKPVVDAVLPPIATIFKTVFGIIVDNLKSSIQIILAVVKGLLQVMNGDVEGGLNTIVDGFKNKFTKIGEFLTTVKDEFIKIGMGIINGLYDSIVTNASKVWDAIKNLVLGPIGDLKNMLNLPDLFGGSSTQSTTQGGRGSSSFFGSSIEAGFANAGARSSQTTVIQLLLNDETLAEAVINGSRGADVMLRNARRVF